MLSRNDHLRALRASCWPLDGEAVVLAIGEALDVYTARSLRSLFIDLTREGYTSIYVDLSDCGWLDSTGLMALIGGLKLVRRSNGLLTIVCGDERLLKIFRITGMTMVFSIYTSLPEAIADHVAERGRSPRMTGESFKPHWDDVSGNWLPVRIFLTSSEGHQVIQDAVTGLAEAMAVEIIYAFDPVTGSWYRELLGRIKRSESLPTFEEQTAGAARAINNQLVNKGQAEIDSALAEAVSKLITSVGDRDAVIQIGSVFFVQHRSVIAARNLTPAELVQLERNPVLLKDPAAALHHLQSLETELPCLEP